MPDPLRLSAGHHHFDHRAAPFIALTNGWFDAESVGPVTVAASGADDHTVAALYAGTVDIGLDISPAKVLHDHLAGGDLVIVGAMANGVGQVLTAVPGLATVDDLRGRRIHVVEQGTGVDWHPLRILLRRHGIDPDHDVTLVYGAPYPLFQNADRAFTDGVADARMLLHAEAPKLRAAGYPVLFDFLAEYPVDYPQRCIVTTRRFVDQQAERLTAFLRAMIRGYRFLRDESVYPRAMDIVREHMGDDPGLGFPPGITDHFLGSHYFGFKADAPDGGVSAPSLQRFIDEEVLEGRIPPGLKAASVHDNTPAAAALNDVAARFGTGYARSRNAAGPTAPPPPAAPPAPP